MDKQKLLSLQIKTADIFKKDISYVINVRNINVNDGKKYIFKVKDKNIKSKTVNLSPLLISSSCWLVNFNKVNFNNYEEDSGFISMDDMIKNYNNEELLDLIHSSHLQEFINKIKLHKQMEEFTPDKYVLHKETDAMKNEKINTVLNNNANAAKTAAMVASGKALNNTIMQKVRPQLPMMVRGYSDHPLSNVVLANLFSFAIDNFASDNRKAKWVADAMLVAAMTEFMESFNIEDFMKEILDVAAISIPDELT